MENRLPVEYLDILDNAVDDEIRSSPGVADYSDKLAEVWGILCHTEEFPDSLSYEAREQRKVKRLSTIMGLNEAQIKDVFENGIVDAEETAELRHRIDWTFAYASRLFRECDGDYALISRKLNEQNPYLNGKTPFQAIKSGEIHKVLLAASVR